MNLTICLHKCVPGGYQLDCESFGIKIKLNLLPTARCDWDDYSHGVSALSLSDNSSS